MMKRKMVIMLGIVLLFVWGRVPVFSETTIPQDIQTQIQEQAKEEYPDDYKMQQYTIKNQVNAYKEIQNYSPQHISPQVFTGIIEEAKETYPTDYKMQLYTMKNQVEAIKTLKCTHLKGFLQRS
jgi:hypothetical protein